MPCGTIVLIDELYGSESISQVYGLLLDFYSKLSDNSELKILLYDDMCHLKRFAENPDIADLNKWTKQFADEITKVVDKFHFRNHVDPWCQENCNPEKVTELNGVNTQICEQMFKNINGHKNCKSMNEARFYMLFLYTLDAHNLDINGFSIANDPRHEYRWSKIKFTEVVLDEDIVDVDVLIEKLVDKKIRADFICKLCGSGYMKEGFLKKHMIDKHGEIYEKEKEF